MGFQSILGENKLEIMKQEDILMPSFFVDLNLDQIVQSITQERNIYDLRRYYYFKAENEDTISYRLEVMRELENKRIYQSVIDFTIGMRKSKEFLENSKQLNNELQIKKWNLDAATRYSDSVIDLQKVLGQETLHSRGFQSFYEWLNLYIDSEKFRKLREDTTKLNQLFEEMKYNIQIKRDKVIIKLGYLEEDYCKELQDTFNEQSNEKHIYQKNPFSTLELCALEEVVLEVLKKPYASTFSLLKEYHIKHTDFFDDTLSEFEQEIQFYLSFILYKDKMLEMNFHFCYPNIDNTAEFKMTGGYDLALAEKNAAKKMEVIFNDGYFNKEDKFFVITGPNQGGKTTFARTLGQILYFASMGLLVPCKTASLPIFDGIYTHFAVEENINSGAGKLKEELTRIKTMMEKVTKNSFVIINEIFTSATSYDAYIMGKKVIEYFIEAECLGVYVTHIYELTTNNKGVVSLVATMLSEDSNIRTFKIERKPADGISYANSIVQKYQLSYDQIKERVKK